MLDSPPPWIEGGAGTGAGEETMTYNFDPEGWYERQRRVLDARRAAGEIDDVQLERELAELDRRYDDMLARLDNTFRIPGGGGR